MFRSFTMRYRYARRMEGLGWFASVVVTLLRELHHGPIDESRLSPDFINSLERKPSHSQETKE